MEENKFIQSEQIIDVSGFKIYKTLKETYPAKKTSFVFKNKEDILNSHDTPVNISLYKKSYEEILKVFKYSSLTERLIIAVSEIITYYPKYIFFNSSDVNLNYNPFTNETTISIHIDDVQNPNEYKISEFVNIDNNFNGNIISAVNDNTYYKITVKNKLNLDLFNEEILYLTENIKYEENLSDFSMYFLHNGIIIPEEKTVGIEKYEYEIVMKLPVFNEVSYDFNSKQFKNFLKNLYEKSDKFDEIHANRLLGGLIPNNISSITIGDENSVINNSNLNQLFLTAGTFFDNYINIILNLFNINYQYDFDIIKNYYAKYRGNKQVIYDIFNILNIPNELILYGNDDFVTEHDTNVSISENENFLYEKNSYSEIAITNVGDEIVYNITQNNCIQTTTGTTYLNTICPIRYLDECDKCEYEIDNYMYKISIDYADIYENICNEIEPQVVFSNATQTYQYVETEGYNPTFMVDVFFNCNIENDDLIITTDITTIGGTPPYTYYGLQPNQEITNNRPYYLYATDRHGCVSHVVTGITCCQEPPDCEDFFFILDYECLSNGTILAKSLFGGLDGDYTYEGVEHNSLVSNGEILYGRAESSTGCVIEKTIVVDCPENNCNYLELKTILEVIEVTDEIITLNINYEVFGDNFNDQVDIVKLTASGNDLIGTPVVSIFNNDSGAKKYNFDISEQGIPDTLSIEIAYRITIENCVYETTYNYNINIQTGNHVQYDYAWQ